MSKKAAFLFIAAIVLAIVVISVVSIVFWGPQPERAYVYVTTEGFGAADVENKMLIITPGDSVADVFGMKYEEYYEFFGKPLIRNNEIVDFLGKKKGNGGKIRVYIDDVLTMDITQAYLGNDAHIKVVYQK